MDSYLWEFGDGQNSSAKDPSHLYSDPGTYTVNLVVTKNGCRASCQGPVVVNSYPNCSWTSNAPVCSDTPVQFRGPALMDSYLWEFGDGAVSSDSNPVHLYSAPGSYAATLTVAKGGCSKDYTKDVAIHPRPDCSLTAPDTVWAGSKGNTASVIQQLGATYIWTVANGEITSGQGTNLITWRAGDVSPATIAVTITTTTLGTKCTCSSSKDVQICRNPDCTISAPIGICAGSHDGYASAPPDPGASFAWTISNGQIISGQGTNQIQWQPTGSSPVTIGVMVSKYYGSKRCSCSNSIQVQVYPNPSCVITAPRNVSANQKNNKASVPNQDPATYEWTITNGVITSGQNTHEITWNALETSQVTIEAKVAKDYGSTQCSCSG